MSHLIDRLLSFPPPLALALVFLLPALEASAFVGFIFPGEIAVLLGGVLANEHRLSLWLVILAASVGAVLGDSIGYEVGRRYGERLLARLPRRIVKPEHIARGQELLRRQGGRAVFIGRFTAALRVLIPGLAGTSRLPYRRFLLYNVLGGVAWSAETAVVGYLAGKSYRAAANKLSIISLGLLAAVIILILVRVLRRSQRVRSVVDKYDPTRRLGRPMSLALALLVGSAWIFFGMLQDVVSHDELALRDPQLLRDFIAHRSPLLTGIAKGTTLLGAGVVVYVLLIATALVVARRARSLGPAVGAVLVLACGQLLRGLTVVWTRRLRPPHDLWLTSAGGYSFPSGHTTTATIGYGLMAWLLMCLMPRVSRRRAGLLIAGAVVLAVAIGLSRIYLGVHWPSDVIGGWSLGVLWLSLVVLAVQFIRRSDPPALVTEWSSRRSDLRRLRAPPFRIVRSTWRTAVKPAIASAAPMAGRSERDRRGHGPGRGPWIVDNPSGAAEPAMRRPEAQRSHATDKDLKGMAMMATRGPGPGQGLGIGLCQWPAPTRGSERKP